VRELHGASRGAAQGAAHGATHGATHGAATDHSLFTSLHRSSFSCQVYSVYLNKIFVTVSDVQVTDFQDNPPLK
jgi:hypothetical protein